MMVDLKSVYENVKNPTKDKALLKKILERYVVARRPDLNCNGIYEKLVTLNDTSDYSRASLEDRERFYVQTYNEWKANIMSLTPEQAAELKKLGVDIDGLKACFMTFGEIRTMDDVNRLRRNPLFDNELNSWELQDVWTHVKSRYISVRQEERIDVKHRLYIGCQNQDLWKMMTLFKEKCADKGIPYYFKAAESSDRDDKMVVYADTEYLAAYIEVLREIAKENPEIAGRIGEPPALTGRIDGWIGVGDEPSKKGKYSFNEIRAKILDDAIEEELLTSIMDNKGKEVVYNGQNVKFNDLFLENAVNQIITKLQNSKDRELTRMGITREELNDVKLRAHIQAQLRRQLQTGLNTLWSEKDDKYQKWASNSKPIFKLSALNGGNIDISISDMDRIVRSYLPMIQEIQPDFLDKLEKKIDEKALKYGVDPATFCFNQDTKQRFEQLSGATIETESEVSDGKQTTQKGKKQLFVEGFIGAYDVTEEEYQREQRLEDEESDIDRVKQIIETNGLQTVLTMDLDGKWIGIPSDKDFRVQYSQKQVSAMARLLKAAQKLTNDTKLNPEGKNYIAMFVNVPYIDYKLRQLRDDLSRPDTYMFDLRKRAREVRANEVLKSGVEATKETTRIGEINEQAGIIEQRARTKEEITKGTVR